MTQSILTTLYAHNLWANSKLFEVCATLRDEQLDATIIGGFGTIRDTVQHIAVAERSYFARITTGQRYPSMEGEKLSISEALAILKTTGAGFVEWANNVPGDETVPVRWGEGETHHIPKAVIMTQVINHATEHRAQIMAILTQLGIEPPELDAWTYFLGRKQ